MKIAIHIVIWIIAVLFIGDQLIQMFSKDTSKNINSDGKANKTVSKGDSEKIRSEPPTPVDPNAVILTGKLDRTLVEIKKCVGNGSELTIEGTLLNQGVDGVLKFYVRRYDESTIIYDDFGNRIVASSIHVANMEDDSSVTAKLIAGVTTKFVVRFNRMPTVGGQTQAKTIKVFQLWTDGFKAEFRNIKIEQVNEQKTITATPPPSAVATPTPTANPVTSQTPTPNSTATPGK